MQKLPTLFAWLGCAALFVWAGAGCKTTNGIEQPQMSAVIGLMGEARYWDSQSNGMHTVKLGNRIPPGSTIQTASGPGNYMDLATAERAGFFDINPKPSFIPPHNVMIPADRVRIFENSTLKLSKVTSTTIGEDRIPDTRLLLEAGSVVIHARVNSPSATDVDVEVIAPKPGKPYYEIQNTNTVLRTQHAIFFFSASGITRVLAGSVTLECTDQGVTKRLSGGQQFDSVTGEISEMDRELLRFLANSGDKWWPAGRWITPTHETPIPRRPF